MGITTLGTTCTGGKVQSNSPDLTKEDYKKLKEIEKQLDDLNEQPPENKPPEITSVEIRDENNTEWLVIDDIGWIFSPNIEFKINVSDSDGDLILYDWNCPEGKFSETGQSDSIWTAPETPGNYTIEVLISDGNGGEIIQSFDIEIFTPPEPQNIILEPTPADSGTKVLGGDSYIGEGILFGDSGCNNTAIGLAVFNIEQILGTIVTEANLIIDIVEYGGDLSFLNQDIQIDFKTFKREDIGTAYDIYNSYPFEGMFRVSGGSVEECLRCDNIEVSCTSAETLTETEKLKITTDSVQESGYHWCSEVLSNGIKDTHDTLMVAIGSPIDYAEIRTNMDDQWDGIVVSPRIEAWTIALPADYNADYLLELSPNDLNSEIVPIGACHVEDIFEINKEN